MSARVPVTRRAKTTRRYYHDPLAPDGALTEPRGCNRWQSLANAIAGNGPNASQTRRGSTVRVRQRASSFCLLSRCFRCLCWTSSAEFGVHAVSTSVLHRGRCPSSGRRWCGLLGWLGRPTAFSALLREELESLLDELLVELEDAAVAGVRVDHQHVVREAAGHVEDVRRRQHPVVIAVREEYGMADE
jgi:hypothetical protein